jgi:hypothetical protein
LSALSFVANLAIDNFRAVAHAARSTARRAIVQLPALGATRSGRRRLVPRSRTSDERKTRPQQLRVYGGIHPGIDWCSERTSNLALNSCPTLWACGPLYRAAMVQRLREKRPVRERNRPDGPRRGPEVLIKTRPKTGLISLRQGTGDSGCVGPVAERQGFELAVRIMGRLRFATYTIYSCIRQNEPKPPRLINIRTANQACSRSKHQIPIL